MSSDHNKVPDESTVIKYPSASLRMHNHIISKVTTVNNALTGFNNNVITLPNWACVPYVERLTTN